MECYIPAKNDQTMGYMKRMLRVWREQGGRNDVDSQRLAVQVRVIKRNGLLSELKIEEIKRKVTEPLTYEREIKLGEVVVERRQEFGEAEAADDREEIMVFDE